MQLATSTITTPYDNPLQYDPAWRNSIAIALAADDRLRLEPEYRHYANDKWIRARKASIIRASKGNKRPDAMHDAIRLAATWYQGSRQSDVKARLEPLLLTSVAFDIIAADMSGGELEVDPFVAYERLFFNIRKDDGRVTQSFQLRQYFAMPNGEVDANGTRTSDSELWRLVGALMGYDTLARAWLWSGAHGLSVVPKEYMFDEMWRVAQSRIFMGLIAGRVGGDTLSKLLAAFTGQVRMVRETGNSTGQGVETSKALMALLGLMMPEVLSAAKDVDTDNILITESIKNRLSAQKTITAQDIPDAGKEIGEEALNARINSHFKTAPESSPIADAVFA